MIPTIGGNAVEANSIEIPITNQPIGSRYLVKWYDSETGSPYNTGVISYANVHFKGSGEKVITFNFPTFIRDLQNQSINNTFGDAVFSLILNNHPSEEQSVEKNRQTHNSK